jgi:hypothetical protein
MLQVTAGISAEQRAAALVVVRSRVPGGPFFIELVDVLDPPVAIGPYENPQTAHEEAKRIREYLAALIRQTGSALTVPESR